MRRLRVVPVLAVMAVGLVLMTSCSSSKKSSDASTTTTAGAGVSVTTGAAGTTVNVTVSDTKGLDGPMTLTTDPKSAPAGTVTFVVKNTSTIDHEAVLLKLAAGQDPAKLEVATSGADIDKVSEDTNMGETGDPNVKPGETRTFTVTDLAAGNYILVCNIAKHYAMGMWAPFTVT